MIDAAVISTRRTARTRRPELVLAPGPLVMGQPGAGTLGDLYGAAWALALTRDGPQLLQVQGGAWVGRSDPDALADLQGVWHVSLAFDQAARPVVAWERDGWVRVRQWDGLTQRYITRGPWPGVDPLLCCDAVASGDPSASDVLLYHLDAARARVVCRVQVEVYAVARPVAAVGAGAVLDQVARVGLALVLYGETEAGPLYLATAPYSVTYRDSLTTGAGMAASVATVVVSVAGTPESLTTGAAMTALVMDNLSRADAHSLTTGAAMTARLVDGLARSGAHSLTTGASMTAALGALPLLVSSASGLTTGASMTAVIT